MSHTSGTTTITRSQSIPLTGQMFLQPNISRVPGPHHIGRQNMHRPSQVTSNSRMATSYES